MMISDLRSHCAVVQPRLYDSAVATHITLKTEGPPGLLSGRRLAKVDPPWSQTRKSPIPVPPIPDSPPSESPDSRFPIWPGIGEGIPDSRFGRNRETGNPRFPIGPGIGFQSGSRPGSRPRRAARRRPRATRAGPGIHLACLPHFPPKTSGPATRPRRALGSSCAAHGYGPFGSIHSARPGIMLLTRTYRRLRPPSCLVSWSI